MSELELIVKIDLSDDERLSILKRFDAADERADIRAAVESVELTPEQAAEIRRILLRRQA